MENDLIRRSAVIDAIRGEREYLIAHKQLGAEHVLAKHADAVIDSIPAVVAVEVVRCMKCVHWGQGYHHKTPTRMGLCARFTRWTPDKFYCGEGKRREDGDA